MAYINKPGGVILTPKQGERRVYKYGEEVPELDEERYPDPSQFSDDEQRAHPYQDINAEANANAAISESGQPNSGSSPVPGNYSELDEDGAVAVVRALENYPHAQAEIVVHERLGQGRRKVEDAAGETALGIADNLMDIEREGSTHVDPEKSGEPFESEVHSTGPQAGQTYEVDPEEHRTPDPSAGAPGRQPGEGGCGSGREIGRSEALVQEAAARRQACGVVRQRQQLGAHVPGLYLAERKRWSPTEGRGQLLSPEGDVLWEDPDWIPNVLHDAGEQSMLLVYLKEQANPTKFLALLNDASVAETDGTMTAVTETSTPGSNGYNRQSVVAGDWTDAGLQGGDFRFDAAEKTFGPISGSTQTATHAALCTTSTGAGLLLVSVPLSATTTIAVGQSFKYTLRWTQQ